jgi:hypothetical protein
MTTYSGLAQLLAETARTAIDDRQAGLDDLALDQGKVSRVQAALTSADRYLFAHTRLADLIHDYVLASRDDDRNFDYARGTLKLQRIIESPSPRYRRMDGGFESID